MSSMELFATHLDYQPVIEQIEAHNELKYVEMGLFEDPQLHIAYSALSLDALGVSSRGDTILDERYLVIRRSVEVEVRIVPQRRGGVRYAIDMQANPAGISFKPGGLFQERCLIRGSITAASSHTDALDLFRLFRREIKKHFVCINRVDWVGPEALKLYKAGIPLKGNDHSTLSAQDFRRNKLTDIIS